MAHADQRAAPQTTPDRLRFARFLADLLDRRFRIPGTSIRIGLDPIIGLIPGIGDVAANLTGSMILLIGAQLGVPKIVLARMGINIAVNTLLGAIPLFGDIISIWYRSNVRNVTLLQRYLEQEPRQAAVRNWLFVVGLVIALLLVMVGVLFAVIWLIKQIWMLV